MWWFVFPIGWMQRVYAALRRLIAAETRDTPMATIPDILARRWPGNQWRMEEDNYETLVWLPGNPQPKPTEAEIRSHTAAVDTEMAADQRRARQASKLEDRADAILAAFENIVEAIDDIQAKLRSQSLSAPLAAANVTAIDNLKQKIAAARAVL